MRWGLIEAPGDCIKVLLRERAFAKREGLTQHERAMQAAISVLRRHLPPDQRMERRVEDKDGEQEA